MPKLKARQIELGQRLRLKRIELRLSLSDAAAEVGLSRQAVNAWETGRTGVSALQLAALALAYGVSADYLLFGVTAIPEELRLILMRSKEPN